MQPCDSLLFVGSNEAGNGGRVLDVRCAVLIRLALMSDSSDGLGDLSDVQGSSPYGFRVLPYCPDTPHVNTID
jgi:hypothetical protein